MHEVAFNGIDHRGQVFSNAGRLEGGEWHQVLRFDQAFDLLQVAAQINHRPEQGFGAGTHGHPLDALAVPPEGQNMPCFMVGSATRACVHDLDLSRAGRCSHHLPAA
ncbi:hypothetical protein D3C72_1531630 [compost metagenome]